MKIATFNINGVNGHLPSLLRWLGETGPANRMARQATARTAP